MIEDIGKDSINEQHLFHGTASRAVGGICREGLDWRMCGENGTAFGQGKSVNLYVMTIFFVRHHCNFEELLAFDYEDHAFLMITNC